VTEDESQVMRILSGMRHFLRWDDSTWSKLKERFILVSSKRLSIFELSDLAEQALEYKTPGGDAPVLVLDTGSANLDLENENSNSEVSKTMAILKEFYSSHALSSQVITHLTKGAKGQGVDSLSNHSARGGSAWEGDAMWTATLSSEGANGQGARILKIYKTRNEHDFREISFSGSIQEAPAKDRFGNDIYVKYRYSIPAKSSEEARAIEISKQKLNDFCELIKKALQNLKDDYPSKNDVKKEVGGHNKDFYNAWDFSEFNENIKSLQLPSGIVKKGRKNYFIWREKDDNSELPF
jgi:hypothetical protein